MGDGPPIHIDVVRAERGRVGVCRACLGEAAELGGATVSTMAAIHRDRVSVPALTLAPLLAAAAPMADGGVPAEVVSTAQEELRAWDAVAGWFPSL